MGQIGSAIVQEIQRRQRIRRRRGRLKINSIIRHQRGGEFSNNKLGRMNSLSAPIHRLDALSNCSSLVCAYTVHSFQQPGIGPDGRRCTDFAFVDECSLRIDRSMGTAERSVRRKLSKSNWNDERRSSPWMVNHGVGRKRDRLDKSTHRNLCIFRVRHKRDTVDFLWRHEPNHFSVRFHRCSRGVAKEDQIFESPSEGDSQANRFHHS